MPFADERPIPDVQQHRDERKPITEIEDTAAALTELLVRAFSDPTVDRSAIGTAAVALLDAQHTADDDRLTVDLTNQLADHAALWAYGEEDPEFRRPHDRAKLDNALKSALVDRLIRAITP